MMVVLLLLLGVIAIAAGMFGLGLGGPVKDSTFGAAVLVSSSLAITGGLILLGLAAAVYELRRVLHTAIRQMRPEALDAGGQRARRMEPRLGTAGGPLGGAGGTSGGAFDGTPGGAPGEVAAHVIPTRFDSPEPTPQLRKPARGEWGLPDNMRPRGPAAPPFQPAGANGTEPRRTPVPPPSGSASSSAPSVPPAERFDTIRPSDYRKPETEESSQRAEAAFPAEVDAKSPPLAPAEAAGTVVVRPVRVIKSGVINEVAYTLFSDGTIETQTADGTQHFGSIDEFRRHLEKSA